MILSIFRVIITYVNGHMLVTMVYSVYGIFMK